ncbi:hypothetical protein [Bosea sp. UC22_33]|uniref:hypothetical protein n=1 Tax=Bosea sp. UC22_33 TaxID=3350165 RepID=UPI00366DDCD7
MIKLTDEERLLLEKLRRGPARVFDDGVTARPLHHGAIEYAGNDAWRLTEKGRAALKTGVL